MEEKKIYKPSQFAQMVGVHVKTLQRWDKIGILIAKRNATNRRYYTDEDYQKALRYQGGEKMNEREEQA